MQEYNAKNNEIALFYSADSHYSMPKAANLLLLDTYKVAVDENNRNIIPEELENQIQQALNNGKKYFIFILNMATTMFGSVDDIDQILPVIKKYHIKYKIHVDAAFGGFIYPFTNPENKLTFEHEEICSFTLDGHKMLQAPYGTGIFLIRKGMMKYSMTKEAQYVMGKDYTLCGSRSGANAVVVWMILMIHGSNGWQAKMEQLIDKKDWVLEKLDKLGVEYYHNPNINIVTIKSKYITPFLMKKYFLVPDTHDNLPNWHKFIIMPHVSQGVLDEFIMDFKTERQIKQ
jgi:glutamate/tyrosine decarboxylase-like PLP-dependent enzyme